MQAPQTPISEDEYFRLDATREERLELWNGYAVAMAGESYNHAVVKDDLMAAIRAQRADCTVLQTSLRVRAPGYGRDNYAYPDGLMVCDAPRFDDRHPPTLLNPTLLIEVISNATARIDLGDKFEAYFRLDSLAEYWIVDPDRVHVRRCTRHGDGVLVHLLQQRGDAVQSDLLKLHVALHDVYARAHLAGDSEGP